MHCPLLRIINHLIAKAAGCVVIVDFLVVGLGNPAAGNGLLILGGAGGINSDEACATTDGAVNSGNGDVVVARIKD